MAGKLQRHRSPEQITGWLRRRYPDDQACHVSHETIYRSLFVQARGLLKKELLAHLRSRRTIRRSRHATAKADPRGRIPDMVSISERPAAVEDRAVPGHGEGDLLSGSSNSYMVTLVERHTRYVMLAEGGEQGYALGHRGADQPSEEATGRALQVLDLGSRQGTLGSQTI